MVSKSLVCCLTVFLIINFIGICSGIKTEKELDEYFHYMTEQMKGILPMVDMMIANEAHAGMKAKLKVAKKHIEELIKRKDALRKQCKDHKKSVAECCKLAENMRTEMQTAIAKEINAMKH